YVQIGNLSVHAGFNLSQTSYICPNKTIFFTNTSTSTYGTYYSMWKFGFDSTTIGSTSTNPAYTFTYPGTYAITLIDSNYLGCRDSIKKTFTLGGPTGTLTFSPDTICATQATHFHLTSTNLTAGVDTFYY